MSRRLRRAFEGGGGLPELNYSPLVTLQFGNPDVAPLFCVPGAGGSVGSFAELTGCLGPALPVFGLQPRGADGEMVPHSTVSAAAECYVRAIQMVVPARPVHLLGHSFGGWVVFEMARRLREAGCPAASVTLLDTGAPDEDASQVKEHDDTEAFLKYVGIFELIGERALDIGPSEVESRDEIGRLALLHERLVSIGMMPRRSQALTFRGPFRCFSACLRTAYWPTASVPDRVHLVHLSDSGLAEGANLQEFAARAEAWRRWAPNLVTCIGPGNHMTALRSPHARSLASLFTSGGAFEALR